MGRFRFQLVYLFYVIALFASSLATFGSPGLCPAFILLIGWTCVFCSTSRPKALALVVTILVVGLCLLLPATRGAPQAWQRMHCSNNLKQIALALHNYHDVYKTFPPAMIPDSQGRPSHSWRVLILPFLELQGLYDAYDFNEPWDGPNNSKLADSIPMVYRCHGSPRSLKSNYVAVVGEHTMWRGDEVGVRFPDVLDGTSHTLLVMEAESSQTNWMEPRDVTYDEAMQMLASRNPEHLRTGHKYTDFFYERWTGRNVALADGSVQFLPQAISRAVASDLLLRDDGADVDLDEVDVNLEPAARLRLDNCFRLAVFVIIALWPLPWVWRKPRPPLPSTPSSSDCI